MDPDEIEFIGEDSEIHVIPNFNFESIHLISGCIGPFNAGIPVLVPLWLGINLRSQQKCRFVTPEWMDIDVLDEWKEEEKTSKNFVRLPCNSYMITAKLLLSIASEDIPRSAEMKTLIKDIFDIRTSKLRMVMENYMKDDSTNIKLDNLTTFEINSVRPYLTHSLDLISRLQRNSHLPNLLDGSQSQSLTSQSIDTNDPSISLL